MAVQAKPAPATQSPITTPAEWVKQKAVWVGFPSDPELWLEDLEPAQAEAAAMCLALAEGGAVKIIASGDEAVKAAKKLVGDTCEVIPAKFGDIWLRDTGPIFANTPEGRVALRFKSNGWGGKYDYPADRVIGDFVAKQADVPIKAHNIVLEGGSVEPDGEGTILTTKECLLNENRNPHLSEDQITNAVLEAFGAKKLLWLNHGLMNDHTDGHIDNIARFIAPGKVVCQRPFGKNDPNAEVLKRITYDLEQMTDAQGRKLEVLRISSPGLVLGYDDEVLAASHMNFIIGNGVVVVPTYGTPSADEAVKGLQKLFPDHKVVGLPSISILRNGGGSFHCMTQQEPAE